MLIVGLWQSFDIILINKYLGLLKFGKEMDISDKICHTCILPVLCREWILTFFKMELDETPKNDEIVPYSTCKTLRFCNALTLTVFCLKRPKILLIKISLQVASQN